jgi:chromosomal replication initiation ATPase DnaA
MLQVSHALALKTRRQVSASSNDAEPLHIREARLAIGFAVSNVFGVEPCALWRATRGVRSIASARQVAMYLAHVSCGMTLTEVGEMFGRDRTTVAHGCLQVEYRRDNPAFDRALDLLGWALPTLVTRPEVRARMH